MFSGSLAAGVHEPLEQIAPFYPEVDPELLVLHRPSAFGFNPTS
jgi:hypothetical protein